MSTQLLLPERYRYIGGALVSVVWVMGWQTMIVSRYRRKAGIAYPQLYAEKAEALASPEAHLFNCAQRAHQHTLERMPPLLIATLVSATKYPVFAAGACAFWAFTRVLYTIGYITGKPANRMIGSVLGEIPLVGLLWGSTYASYQLFIGA